MKDVNIYIYTEYTGSMQSGTGKYHIVLETMVKTRKGEEPVTLNDYAVCEDVTKNRLELLALEKALSHLSKRSRVTIYMASEYITGAFGNDWPETWAQNNFKRRGKPIKHADIWRSIMEKTNEHDITIMYADKTTYSKYQAFELKKIKEK